MPLLVHGGTIYFDRLRPARETWIADRLIETSTGIKMIVSSTCHNLCPRTFPLLLLPIFTVYFVLFVIGKPKPHSLQNKKTERKTSTAAECSANWRPTTMCWTKRWQRRCETAASDANNKFSFTVRGIVVVSIQCVRLFASGWCVYVPTDIVFSVRPSVSCRHYTGSLSFSPETTFFSNGASPPFRGGF